MSKRTRCWSPAYSLTGCPSGPRRRAPSTSEQRTAPPATGTTGPASVVTSPAATRSALSSSGPSRRVGPRSGCSATTGRSQKRCPLAWLPARDSAQVRIGWPALRLPGGLDQAVVDRTRTSQSGDRPDEPHFHGEDEEPRRDHRPRGTAGLDQRMDETAHRVYDDDADRLVA